MLATGDGVFNSADLVSVFKAGEFEDEMDGNSTFDEGDWNGDGDFTTADLVFAFQTGAYTAAAQRDIASARAGDLLFAEHANKRKHGVFVA